jgi:hypothetical protein
MAIQPSTPDGSRGDFYFRDGRCPGIDKFPRPILRTKLGVIVVSWVSGAKSERISELMTLLSHRAVTPFVYTTRTHGKSSLVGDCWADPEGRPYS